jgi:hypothetical protein
MVSRRKIVLMAALLPCFILFFIVLVFGATPILNALGLSDGRPARRILILGNSRTYANDMPAMLTKIADSAQDGRHFDITTVAYAGASLEILQKDPKVAELLSQTWDEVIVQAESRAHSTDDLRASFMTYGTTLLNTAKVTAGKPKLIVNWAYSTELYPATRDPEFRAGYFREIQSDYETLAARGGASLVNVGRTWEMLLNTKPNIQLYKDGNHPSLTGSYLEALVLYKSLSPNGVSRVTYVPDGVTPEIASNLGKAVMDE